MNTVSALWEVAGTEKAVYHLVPASASCDSAKNMVTQVLKLAMLDWTRAFRTEDGGIIQRETNYRGPQGPMQTITPRSTENGETERIPRGPHTTRTPARAGASHTSPPHGERRQHRKQMGLPVVGL